MAKAFNRRLLLTHIDGRPHADRSWTESFAQLVGTILSLWDASALDAAGQDGEVAPTFINLADASIKMVIHHIRHDKDKLLTRDLPRSRPYPLDHQTFSHYKTFSAYRPPERIATCFISTHSIRLPNGLQQYVWLCTRTRLCKKHIPDH